MSAIIYVKPKGTGIFKLKIIHNVESNLPDLAIHSSQQRSTHMRNKSFNYS